MNKKISLMLLLILCLAGCTSNKIIKNNAIAVFKAKNESTDKIYFYQLLDDGKILGLDSENHKFNVIIQIYNLNSCFESYIENNKVLNKVIVGCNHSYDTYPDVQKFNNSSIKNKDELVEAIATLEHDLCAVKVFQVKGRTFVNIELNVNWISPIDMYEYRNGNLIRINSLPDEMQIQEIYVNDDANK